MLNVELSRGRCHAKSAGASDPGIPKLTLCCCSYFYAKGEQSNDREVRKPRQRGSSTANAEGSARARRSALGNRDPWADLPPLEEMIDGVQQFLRHYFQLGFIPKERYLETLRNDHRSVNVFLLLSILSVSARLSPQLRARYGDGLTASQFFMDRAQRIAEKEVYAEPLLERCQAYYVLSMAQEAHDLGKHSRVSSSIAGHKVCKPADFKDKHGNCHMHRDRYGTSRRKLVSDPRPNSRAHHPRRISSPNSGSPNPGHLLSTIANACSGCYTAKTSFILVPGLSNPSLPRTSQHCFLATKPTSPPAASPDSEPRCQQQPPALSTQRSFTTPRAHYLHHLWRHICYGVVVCVEDTPATPGVTSLGMPTTASQRSCDG